MRIADLNDIETHAHCAPNDSISNARCSTNENRAHAHCAPNSSTALAHCALNDSRAVAHCAPNDSTAHAHRQSLVLLHSLLSYATDFLTGLLASVVRCSFLF